MATVATRREKKSLVSEKRPRIPLTPTGLLMEGDFTTYPVAGEIGMLRQLSTCAKVRLEISCPYKRHLASGQ